MHRQGQGLEKNVRAGPNRGNLPRSVQPFLTWADGRDLALIEDDDIDRALSPTVFFGKEGELGGRLLDSGADVSGSTVLSHRHAGHPSGSTLPTGFRKAAPEHRDKSSLCAYGLDDAHGADAIMVGHTVQRETYRRQRQKAHYNLLLFPEERPQRYKVGTTDNSLLPDSSWQKGIDPMFAILASRPDGHRFWTLHVAPIPWRFPQNNGSPRHGLGADRAWDLRPEEAAQRQGRWKPLKANGRYEWSARLNMQQQRVEQIV